VFLFDFTTIVLYDLSPIGAGNHTLSARRGFRIVLVFRLTDCIVLGKVMIQLDATHRKFIQRPLSQHVSAIRYVHRQENNAVNYRIRCAALVLPAVVG
jgi:hypothetical protein